MAQFHFTLKETLFEEIKIVKTSKASFRTPRMFGKFLSNLSYQQRQVSIESVLPTGS